MKPSRNKGKATKPPKSGQGKNPPKDALRSTVTPVKRREAVCYDLDDMAFSQVIMDKPEVGWDSSAAFGSPVGREHTIVEILKHLPGRTADEIADHPPSTPPLVNWWMDSPGMTQECATPVHKQLKSLRRGWGRGRGRGASSNKAAILNNDLLQRMASVMASKQNTTDQASPICSPEHEASQLRRSSRLRPTSCAEGSAVNEISVPDRDQSFELFDSTALPADRDLSTKKPDLTSPSTTTTAGFSPARASSSVNKTTPKAPATNTPKSVGFRTPKQGNQSLEELWTDEELFESDSFIQATQNVFDSEGLASPALLKRKAACSTPIAVGTRKAGRYTFSLDPVVTSTSTCSSLQREPLGAACGGVGPVTRQRVTGSVVTSTANFAQSPKDGVLFKAPSAPPSSRIQGSANAGFGKSNCDSEAVTTMQYPGRNNRVNGQHASSTVAPMAVPPSQHGPSRPKVFIRGPNANQARLQPSMRPQFSHNGRNPPLGQSAVRNPGSVGQPPVRNPGSMAQPAVRNPGSVAQPAVRNPGSVAQPAVRNPGSVAQPAVRNPGSVAQPPIRNPGSVAQPAVRNPGSVAQPAVRNPGSVAQPAVRNPGSVAHPAVRNPGSVAQPAVRNPGSVVQTAITLGQPPVSSLGLTGHQQPVRNTTSVVTARKLCNAVSSHDITFGFSQNLHPLCSSTQKPAAARDQTVMQPPVSQHQKPASNQPQSHRVQALNVNEMEMMDVSISDDLLASLAEPDDLLDTQAALQHLCSTQGATVPDEADHHQRGLTANLVVSATTTTTAKQLIASSGNTNLIDPGRNTTCTIITRSAVNARKSPTIPGTSTCTSQTKPIEPCLVSKCSVQTPPVSSVNTQLGLTSRTNVPVVNSTVSFSPPGSSQGRTFRFRKTTSPKSESTSGNPKADLQIARKQDTAAEAGRAAEAGFVCDEDSDEDELCEQQALALLEQAELRASQEVQRKEAATLKSSSGTPCGPSTQPRGTSGQSVVSDAIIPTTGENRGTQPKAKGLPRSKSFLNNAGSGSRPATVTRSQAAAGSVVSAASLPPSNTGQANSSTLVRNNSFSSSGSSAGSGVGTSSVTVMSKLVVGQPSVGPTKVGPANGQILLRNNSLVGSRSRTSSSNNNNNNNNNSNSSSSTKSMISSTTSSSSLTTDNITSSSSVVRNNSLVGVGRSNSNNSNSGTKSTISSTASSPSLTANIITSSSSAVKCGTAVSTGGRTLSRNNSFGKGTTNVAANTQRGSQSAVGDKASSGTLMTNRLNAASSPAAASCTTSNAVRLSAGQVGEVGVQTPSGGGLMSGRSSFNGAAASSQSRTCQEKKAESGAEPSSTADSLASQSTETPAGSQRCSPQEIERKRREAVEKRNKRLRLSKPKN